MKFWFRLPIYLAVAVCFSSAIADSYVSFFRALGLDDVRTVQRLLDAGFDPNAADEKGQLALLVALRDDSPRVAEALLAHPGLKVDATNAAGETALMMAALHGRLEAARYLLERGAAVNRPGWTPLHYAASGTELRMLTLLLERGAQIDAPSENGSTPLMMAARYGAIDGAELLLQRGADPKLLNHNGLSAADFARGAGRDRLADRLEQRAR